MKRGAPWLLFFLQVLFVDKLQAQALTASNDAAFTFPNVPVVIAILTNDTVVASNQTAILRVTQPLHGTVIINQGPITNAVLSNLFRFAAVQVSNTAVQMVFPYVYPSVTEPDGTWQTVTVSDESWTTGFFPGEMWLIYEQTGDTNFLNWAESWMNAILPEEYSTNTDDVGFMFETSYGNGYRLTGNPDYKAVLFQAANSLSARFNPAVGCLADDTMLALNTNPPPFQVIMDTMMNAELLYTAYDLGGSTNYYNMAVSHAGRALTNQIRSDGSTYHMVIYNDTNGAVLLQGNRVDIPALDTWARGHSWATHGFTTAYQETGDVRFLNAAKEVANFYISQVPPDYVPYWYYQTNGMAPSPPYRDSSAAAVTLSALVELSQLVTNAADGATYWQASLNIFNSLSSSNYLAQGTCSSGILLHGDSVDTETDASLVYGDYYFLQAMERLTDLYGQRTVTYIPDTNFSGVDSFTYQACDSGGNTSEATVIVTVGQAVPSLTVAIGPNGFPTISFPTTTGVSYFVQYANRLANAVAWNLLVTNVAGTGSSYSITDTNFVSQRFYRLGVNF